MSHHLPQYAEYMFNDEQGKQEVSKAYSHHKKALQILMAEDKKLYLKQKSDERATQAKDKKNKKGKKSKGKEVANDEQKEGEEQHEYKPKTWLLKSPFHMFAPDSIVREYPQAKFVCLHRDPVEVFPSFSSLVNTGRPVYSKDYNSVMTGKDVTEVLIRGLNTFEEFRDTQNFRSTGEKYLDVQYRDILKDPIAVIEKIYQFAGLTPIDGETKNNMLTYLAQNPKDKFGVHKYTLKEFGIDESDLKSNLDWYYKKYVNI